MLRETAPPAQLVVAPGHSVVGHRRVVEAVAGRVPGPTERRSTGLGNLRPGRGGGTDHCGGAVAEGSSVVERRDAGRLRDRR